MKEIWDGKHADCASIFTRSYRNKGLNKLYSAETEKEYPKTPQKFLSTLWVDKDEEKTKIEQNLRIEEW